jgi:uncharacterized membrane protein
MSTHKQNYLRRLGKALPTDIAVGLATAAVSAGFVLLVQLSVLLTTIVALPLVLFVPGYFVLATLFPRRARATPAPRTRLDRVERAALSYAVSLALVPVVALAVTLLSVPLTAETVVLGLALVVAACTPLVVRRRKAVPEHDRYQVSGVAPFSRLRELFSGDLAVNAVLAVAVVTGLLVTMGVILAPPQDSAYTELALLTENGSGELVADGYPETIDATGEELTVQVTNREHEAQTYTLVAELQRVESPGTAPTVVERAELTRTDQRIAAGETWTTNHTVTPELAGEDLRVVYYVYTGDAPQTPSTASAYRSVHFWTDVPEE